MLQNVQIPEHPSMSWKSGVPMLAMGKVEVATGGNHSGAMLPGPGRDPIATGTSLPG